MRLGREEFRSGTQSAQVRKIQICVTSASNNAFQANQRIIVFFAEPFVLVHSTHQIRNQARAADGFDSLLSRLRLLLPINDRHVRDMDLQKVVPARTASELCHSLNERHALDITNGTTQLNYANIRLFVGIIDGYPGDPLDPILNRIRDVRDDLNGLTQVCPLPLLLDNVLVYLARSNIVVACKSDVQIALVVAKIEIDLAAVGENEDLAMPVHCLIRIRWAIRVLYVLPRVHSPRIDIKVRVDLDRRYLQSLGFQKQTRRGGC